MDRITSRSGGEVIDREIKFRCWNTYSKIMHDWNELVEKNKIHLLAYPRSSYPVMQFIGMKDCNGVDIYEGDTCLIIDSDFDEIYTVKYNDSQCKFILVDFADRNCGDMDDYEIRVIGNVYQNPELIK